MRHINQLDLFSGIGGFHLGFEKAGYKVTSYFSEIDKHAIAVYKHKFKDSTYVGSVTDVRGADLPAIDLITFGSPCQDFSLAGKRAGMEGQRSSLILEAIRLIRECRPSVFIWENVKGTFSSNNGADFWAIIQAFANIGGYRLEWQLLNTSWVLPQNRERIYLVGYSTTPTGDWRGVFPIGEDSRQTDELQGHNPRANTITTRYTGNVNGSFIGEHQQPAQSMRIKTANEQGYQEAEAGDAVRLYQPDSNTQRGRVGKGIAHTLETTGQQGVVQPNYQDIEIGDFRNDEGWRPRKDGLSPCLATRRHSEVDISNTPPLLKFQPHYEDIEIGDIREVVQPVQIGQSDKTYAVQNGTVIGKDGQDAFTIRSSNPNGVVVPNYSNKSLNETIEQNTLTEGEPKALDLYNRSARDESPTLTEPHHNSLRMFDGYRIRRLTPIECERLQGFPDNHTAYGNYDGEVKPMSNTQRYKQCGNAVTVDIVALVAKQLKPIFDALPT